MFKVTDFITLKVRIKWWALTFRDWLLVWNTALFKWFIYPAALLPSWAAKESRDGTPVPPPPWEVWHAHCSTACSCCSERGEIITPIPPLSQGIPAVCSCLAQLLLGWRLKYWIQIEREAGSRVLKWMNSAQRKCIYIVCVYSFLPFESSKFTIFHDAQEVANRSGDRPSMSTLSILAPWEKEFQVYGE